jgi:aldehyde:ferredoxin oxidoreductase
MGYMRGGTILRIDLNSGKMVNEPTANYEKRWFGGRGLNSRILYTETGPAVDPLGPENVLMFSLGPFTGTMVPGSGRVEVAAKSPVIGIWVATGDRS